MRVSHTLVLCLYIFILLLRVCVRRDVGFGLKERTEYRNYFLFFLHILPDVLFPEM